MASSTSVTASDVVAEVHRWLEANWDPELTVAEWWGRLGLAGWSAPMLPPDWYGRGATREEALLIAQAVGAAGAVRAPVGVGLGLAAPVLDAYGTDDQRERYLRDIVTGQAGWCQLFSEPGAGSDLAGVTTRAVHDGDEFVVNGQKVWTSNAMDADFAILVARTNVDVPKHRGITYFVIDMNQPGIDVRPLREMNGHSAFNEVFLTDARVHVRDVVGEVDDGWAVARATLAFERSVIGAGSAGIGAPGAEPGEKPGSLHRRCSEFTRPGRVHRTRGSFLRTEQLVELARANGKSADPLVRQDLARLYVMNEVARMNTLRAKALRASGKEIPGLANIAKLATTRFVKLTRDAGMRIAGAAGTLHDYDGDGSTELAKVTEAVLFAQGSSIYGGTDEIQHNILGERVLGLPREPSDEKVVPFRDLPRNA